MASPGRLIGLERWPSGLFRLLDGKHTSRRAHKTNFHLTETLTVETAVHLQRGNASTKIENVHTW